MTLVYSQPRGPPILRDRGSGGTTRSPLSPVSTDLAALTQGAAESEVRRLALADASRPFDLARGPMLRLQLLRLGDAEHVLLADLHHIATDGWSNGIFIRELMELYEAFSHGLPSP